jgi:AraC family transcriptional activator FtrA
VADLPLMRKIPPNFSGVSSAGAPLPDVTTSGPLVVALAYDGLCTFEFAIVAEIFGLPRPEMGRAWYRFAACAVEQGPLRAQGGLRVRVDAGPERLDALLAEAHLIVVPGWKGPDVPVPDALCKRLTVAWTRGARLASICSGAFVLAATGLLDGRRAATHWRYAQSLQRAYPRIDVDANVLYVENERLLTSAGSAAGIDLLLHVIRSDFGPDAANRVARRLVVPPHRSGGQAQFVERPVAAYATAPDTGLGPLLDRVRAEPARRWRVADLARVAAMSERTFLRRFAEATGETPVAWLAAVRTEEVRRLLETTTYPVEEVARRSGFGNAAAMRHHFVRTTGLAPREYRERFRRSAV